MLKGSHTKAPDEVKVELALCRTTAGVIKHCRGLADGDRRSHKIVRKEDLAFTENASLRQTNSEREVFRVRVRIPHTLLSIWVDQVRAERGRSGENDADEEGSCGKTGGAHSSGRVFVNDLHTMRHQPDGEPY